MEDGCALVLFSLRMNRKTVLNEAEALEKWNDFVKAFVTKVTGILSS